MTRSTLLYEAIRTGDVTTAERLILQSDIDELNNTYCYYYLSHLAVMMDDDRILRLLISKGVDMNQIDAYNFTPLFHAVIDDKRTVVARLLMEEVDDSYELKRPYESLSAFDWAEKHELPFAKKENWERMKFRMTDSKVDTILLSFLAASGTEENSNFLSSFIHQVSAASMMMANVMEFLNPGPLDAPFISMNSEEYQNFASSVVNAFASLPANDRQDKPLHYFLRFINKNRKEPISRERAAELMKVLELDRIHHFGCEQSVCLSTIEYDYRSQTVSLYEEEQEELSDEEIFNLVFN